MVGQNMRGNMTFDFMEKQIKNRISRAIKERVFPGAVVGLVKKNNEKLVLPFGNYTYKDDSQKILKDSIFDVASITKSIPTSSLALKLIDEGKLKTDDKLIDFVPEFNNSDRENVLIKHLLTQTLDFDFHLSAHKDKSPEEILNVIFTAEFKSKPGTKFLYTNATSILLGLVVERIFNESLDKLGEKYFFEPLKMEHTLFKPLKRFSKEEIIPTEIQEWRGGLAQGEIHDESAYILGQKMAAGSAGLFSTAPDLLNFLEMLLNHGSLNGQKYFSPEIIEQMRANQLSDIRERAGLGWELNQPRYMGKHCAEQTFGKTGFTGCVVICDISKEVGLAFLSNYTYPKRKQDAALINSVRSDIADIVFGNL